jgi:hypothetical protein
LPSLVAGGAIGAGAAAIGAGAAAGSAGIGAGAAAGSAGGIGAVCGAGAAGGVSWAKAGNANAASAAATNSFMWTLLKSGTLWRDGGVNAATVKWLPRFASDSTSGV